MGCTVSTRELDAAGITDPDLRAAYTASRQINASHGRTYFLATRLLPIADRPAVHALYGFARLTDDIVDGTLPKSQQAAELFTLERTMWSDGHPVLRALRDTVARYGIDQALFADFLASMRMDLHVTEYATFEDLATYMHGSAGVIGLQMLPVLGTAGPRAEAEPYAAALGEAFQLTNFLRDVGEDLDRGRIYLPMAELNAFGVDRARLRWAHRTGKPDPNVRKALAHLVAHTYAVYRRAEPGIALLRPESRPCVSTAATLYRGILDRIVDADYSVLNRRAVVPTGQRLWVALPGVTRAAGQNAKAWARRLTSRPRSPRNASIGVPGSESSEVNSHRRISLGE
ncbi:phytoene synthase [Actinocrispum wychmicini]|uniref:Phytoene synthase n=1 Tax=Actinocrispum wychmicini TaxID=1213861 RepID=A0A4R2IU03_9PSEU|nr:phytoene/squalene synthase family protein [Actinocrispum wychmicini]TCO48112.1 phytoene synthase [Actinocrispum wychmicini]